MTLVDRLVKRPLMEALLARTKSESQPNASPRDISEEEAAQMAELVRDKALAAENQRQQWKRARMRDTGEAKTW